MSELKIKKHLESVIHKEQFALLEQFSRYRDQINRLFNDIRITLNNFVDSREVFQSHKIKSVFESIESLESFKLLPNPIKPIILNARQRIFGQTFVASVQAQSESQTDPLRSTEQHLAGQSYENEAPVLSYTMDSWATKSPSLSRPPQGSFVFRGSAPSQSSVPLPSSPSPTKPSPSSRPQPTHPPRPIHRPQLAMSINYQENLQKFGELIRQLKNGDRLDPREFKRYKDYILQHLPKSNENHTIRFAILFIESDPITAIERLKEVLKVETNNAVAKELLMALDDNPINDYTADFSKAMRLMANGRYCEAVDALKLIYKENQDLDILEKIGFCHLHLEQYSEAIVVYNFLLSKDPQNTSIIHLMAASYIRTEQIDLALKMIERGLALSPNHTGLNDCHRFILNNPPT